MPWIDIRGLSVESWPQALVVHMSFSTWAVEAAGGVKRACLEQPDFVFGCQLKQKPHHSELGSLLVEKPLGSSELVIWSPDSFPNTAAEQQVAVT